MERAVGDVNGIDQVLGEQNLRCQPVGVATAGERRREVCGRSDAEPGIEQRGHDHVDSGALGCEGDSPRAAQPTEDGGFEHQHVGTAACQHAASGVLTGRRLVGGQRHR